MSALWALHNSVFTVLLLFIGIALLGLGRAGVAAGITPRAFAWLAPLGTGLLAVACAGRSRRSRRASSTACSPSA